MRFCDRATKGGTFYGIISNLSGSLLITRVFIKIIPLSKIYYLLPQQLYFLAVLSQGRLKSARNSCY